MLYENVAGSMQKILCDYGLERGRYYMLRSSCVKAGSEPSNMIVMGELRRNGPPPAKPLQDPITEERVI